MTGVVLRCPNCGTTRATPGECAACHADDVRYFCTNHEPGRWIDAPACTACGAVFGAKPPPPPSPRAPPPVARPPAPSRPRAAPPPRMPPPARPPGYGSARPGGTPGPGGPGGGRGRRDDPFDASPADDEPDLPRGRPRSLPELLIEIARERERRRGHRDAPPRPETSRRAGPVVRGMGLGGCLIRAVMLLFFLFLILSGGLFSFFGYY